MQEERNALPVPASRPDDARVGNVGLAEPLDEMARIGEGVDVVLDRATLADEPDPEAVSGERVAVPGSLEVRALDDEKALSAASPAN